MQTLQKKAVRLIVALFIGSMGISHASVQGDKMNIDIPIIQSDLIISGIPQRLRWSSDGSEGLFKIDNPVVISVSSKDMPKGKVVVLMTKDYNFGSPIILMDKPQIMFLQKTLVSKTVADKLNIKNEEVIYSICDDQLSSIDMNKVNDSLIEDIKSLSKWMSLDSDETKLIYLISLLKKEREVKNYQESAIGLIYSVVLSERLKKNKYDIVKAVLEVQSPGSWQGSPFKRTVSNYLINFLNQEESRRIYANDIKFILRKWEVELTLSGDKYSASVVGRTPGSRRIGPLPS